MTMGGGSVRYKEKVEVTEVCNENWEKLLVGKELLWSGMQNPPTRKDSERAAVIRGRVTQYVTVYRYSQYIM